MLLNGLEALVLLLISICSALDPRLVREIFDENQVTAVDLYTCSTKDALDLMIMLKEDFIVSNNLQPIEDKVVGHNHKIGIFMDLRCNSNLALLTKASEELMSIGFFWLLYGKPFFPLPSLKLGLYSHVYHFDESKVYELTKTTYTSEMSLVKMGNGTLREVRKQRQSLDGALLNGGLLFFEDVFDRDSLQTQLPDLQYQPTASMGNRYSYVVHLLVADLFNYSLKVVVADDWGVKSSNGSYTGLLGLLQRQEVHLTFVLLLLLPERINIGYPSDLQLEYWMAIVFKQPRALGTYKAMIMELTPSVWVSIGALICAGSLLFFLVQNSCEKVKRESLDGSFLHIVGTVTNQGIVMIQDKLSIRLASISFLVFGSIVLAYYNAGTLTSLLSPSPLSIRDLKQFLNSKIPTYFIDAAFFKSPQARSRVLSAAVLHKFEPSLEMCDFEEGLNHILDGAAFVHESFMVFQGIDRNFKEQDKCDLTVIPAKTPPAAVVSYIARDSHLREMFARGMSRMREHGLMSRENQRWIAREPKCLIAPQFVIVKLEAVTVALALHTSGVILSFTIFICELIMWRKFRKQN